MAAWYDRENHSESEALGVDNEIPRLDNQSTPKIPPAFDGRSSWFAYEEAIDDWLDITTLPAEKHGPSLKTDYTVKRQSISRFWTGMP